jgi:AcrR family transcriptional regulator
LVDQHRGADMQPREVSRRQERAQRILDAAAALLLRWGYNKTTIDDIARQANVAKGTIYLHWKTREELFAALITREKLEIGEEIKQRLAEDPEGVTLRGIARCVALILLKRPLMKAVLLHDIEVLGKLTSSDYRSETYVEKLAGFKTYIALLREHGLVRTDLSLRAQIYIYSAIFMGFFLIAPLMPEEFTLPDEEMANLIGEAVHRTLEVDRTISPDELQAISHPFMQFMNERITTAREQFQHEIEP